jgi:hypothetical protein
MKAKALVLECVSRLSVVVTSKGGLRGAVNRKQDNLVEYEAGPIFLRAALPPMSLARALSELESKPTGGQDVNQCSGICHASGPGLVLAA